MSPVTRATTAAVLVADAALLLLAGVLALWTYVELRDPGADPLTGIGYLLAAALALLALISLLLASMSTRAAGPWRAVCLALAVLPLVGVVLFALAS